MLENQRSLMQAKLERDIAEINRVSASLGKAGIKIEISNPKKEEPKPKKRQNS